MKKNTIKILALLTLTAGIAGGVVHTHVSVEDHLAGWRWNVATR